MPLLTTLAVATAVSGKPAVQHVVYEQYVHAGKRYHVVTCDLSSGMLNPKTLMASGSRPVWSLIAKEQPIAAITGTFFAPGVGIPVADVLVDGNLLARGDRGSVLAVDHMGAVSIFDERFKQSVDWANYRYGMRGAVRVVTNGVVHPNPKAQSFKDRRIWSSASRTGVGLTKHNKLILIATTKSVTLSQLGKAMVAKGVKDGLSLDGGSSTCLYYNGKMVIRPQRQLTNMFVVNAGAPYAAGFAQVEPPTQVAASRPVESYVDRPLGP